MTEKNSMGNVIYADFNKKNPMWELHLHVKSNGQEGYVRHVRCDDKNYWTLISRKARQLEEQRKGFRIYLDGQLVHEASSL
tara:strand:- start:412 stop:654 length:243 start_codon:yes stop_codon:yes gene_type:complete